MKKIMFNAAVFAAAMFLATSCSDRKTAENEDSSEVAEDQNDAKFDDTKMEKDTEFAVKAADGAMLEIQLGELAQQKGVSQEVKNFGKMLVDDHSKAAEELKALAQTKNISLPATMSEDCQKTYNDLAAKDAEDFDEAFAEHMIKDHKQDIDDFKKEAEKGEDPDLKSWAAGKISTLEHHLDMAENVEKSVDGQKKSTGKL